ncbi:hypothetical protein [Actinacidiphila acididurans]|uniref:PH domain-containing protein n=1 Tax=Actinacidiphila acididurans TaxID=2784346 RepID=A0ABS2TTH9_9ACTN|nr:hypothetical protein [Actinacidiphila acididurans]MBM9506638.1 hypothetical protein [Actinacidiphila acididurans]
MAQVEKVERRLSGEALAGERVLYGVLAFRIGGVRRTMVGGAAGLAGVAGAAMAAAATRGRTAVPAAPLPVPGRVIVALTDQRLLVFSIGGAFVAKPKKLLYSIPFDAIAWLPKPELVPGAAQALRVQVGVSGEGILGFEFPRLKVNEGRNMINRLRRALPPETDTETAPGSGS